MMKITEEMQIEAREKFDAILAEALETCATIHEAEVQIVKSAVKAAMEIALKAVVDKIIDQAILAPNGADVTDGEVVYYWTMDGKRHRVRSETAVRRFMQ